MTKLKYFLIKVSAACLSVQNTKDESLDYRKISYDVTLTLLVGVEQ